MRASWKAGSSRSGTPSNCFLRRPDRSAGFGGRPCGSWRGRDNSTSLVDNFQSIFENAPVGIFQTAPGGQLLSANPALARMFGFPSPEALLEKWNGGAYCPFAPGQREEILRK